MSQLREVREELAGKEAKFEKELATAQKLSALYKQSGEERAARVTELTGIVRELKEALEVPNTSNT